MEKSSFRWRLGVSRGFNGFLRPTSTHHVMMLKSTVSKTDLIVCVNLLWKSASRISHFAHYQRKYDTVRIGKTLDTTITLIDGTTCHPLESFRPCNTPGVSEPDAKNGAKSRRIPLGSWDPCFRKSVWLQQQWRLSSPSPYVSTSPVPSHTSSSTSPCTHP